MLRETEIHAQFAHWLKKHGYAFLHQRTDRKTTTQIGDPDFCVARDGRVLFIEVKVPGGKMSEAQLARRKELMDAGNIAELAYSLQDCIFSVETLLGKEQQKRAGGHPGACWK